MQGLTKSTATTMNPLYKTGAGWNYDDPSLTYDGEFDNEGRPILYDSIGGSLPVMTGMAKSASVTLTPLTKNAA